MRLKLLLPLYAGGELDTAALRNMESHLALCGTCHAEAAQYSELISTARASWVAEYRLPAGARNKIALEAAARSSEGFWWARLLLLPLQRQSVMMATAAGLVVGLVALSVGIQNGLEPTRGESVTIEVVAEGKVVRLAWWNGQKNSYKVYKTTDPRDLGRGEVHVVRGNAWTDVDPGPSRIVYYKVE